MRINKRWNQKGRPRTAQQMANAVAAAIWKLASQMVLNLENENFETTTQGQRLDVMEELAIYLMHQADRRIYELAGEENRSGFVSALALDLARMLEDSRIDVQGRGQYQSGFIEKINLRCAEYANYKFDVSEGAGFTMRSALGMHVAQAMGERDNKWIPDYIIGREAPTAEIALKSSLGGLVNFQN